MWSPTPAGRAVALQVGLRYAAGGQRRCIRPYERLTSGWAHSWSVWSPPALAGVPGAILWGTLVARTQRRRPFVVVPLGRIGDVLLSLPLLAPPWTATAVTAVGVVTELAPALLRAEALGAYTSVAASEA